MALPDSSRPRSGQPIVVGGAWWLAGAASVSIFAWASWAIRFITLRPTADTWVHLAYIRRTLEHGWFPGDAFYAGIH